MLPIYELVDFSRTLDDEGHSPVADRFAEAWGLGRPKFVRSSASHVFVAPRRDDEGRVVLRIRPQRDDDDRTLLERCSRAAASWSAADAPVVNAVASPSGHFTEQEGRYVAHVLTAAEGETLEERDDLVEHAADWGEALGRIHLKGHGLLDLPDATERLRVPATSPVPADTAALAVVLRHELDRLPRDPEVHGVLHGDPEADNVVLTDDGPVLIDFDRVHTGWYAADVAFALRDWGTVADGVDLDAEVPRRFLEGYGRVRDLTHEELGWLPLLARATAVGDLIELGDLLGEGRDPDWPGWAVSLDARLRAHVVGLRRELSLPEGG
jgi:Ser/Thr protein kinase RdoA (MazF antagonist)